jgi:Fe-S cluster biogenesis protein NfuA
MFIQTEATPNPATLKFLPGRTVLDNGSLDMPTKDQAPRSPLAERLFAINGVSGVCCGHDFVTVTKAQGDWQHLKPAILGAIMDFYMGGEPILRDSPSENAPSDEFFDEKDSGIVETIKELLETRVRPAVAADGGDIIFKGFRDGIVYLGMKGSCSGCPSSSATLKHGVQNLLRHFVPDVREVQQV